MRALPTRSIVGTCQWKDCGKAILKLTKQQKYCRECSAKADAERQGRWARAHGIPQSAEQRRTQHTAETLRLQANGLAISRAVRPDAGWYVRGEPSLCTLVRFSFPYDQNLSKNAIWRSGQGGHVYLREESRRAKQALIDTVRLAVRNHRLFGGRWPQRKTWLDLMVEKPDHSRDAINMLDAVADCVKKAIAVDDNWFSVRRLDWTVVKESPMLWIGLGVEGDLDERVCSYCGRVLPLSWFKAGRRECRDCKAGDMPAEVRTVLLPHEMAEGLRQEAAGW